MGFLISAVEQVDCNANKYDFLNTNVSGSRVPIVSNPSLLQNNNISEVPNLKTFIQDEQTKEAGFNEQATLLYKKSFQPRENFKKVEIIGI